MTTATDLSLAVADRLGARLCRDAVWAGDRCNWIGPSMEFVRGSWQVAHRAFGPELYNGTSGIGLFLAQLFGATGEARFLRTAEGALRHALARREDLAGHSRAGVYSGLVGILHAALVLSEHSDDPTVHGALPELADELVALGPVAEGIDVVMGSAGAIPALLDLGRRTGDARLGALAHRHGDHLLTLARHHDDHWTWDTLQGGSPRPLTGLAHGAAGVAWAFFELHAAGGDPLHLEAARMAVAYEQRHYSPAHRNWPDFRDHSDSGHVGTEPIHALAWCHGAPGIALVRLRAFALTRDPALAAHARHALQTTAEAVSRVPFGPPTDFTYCHGTAGLLEPLLEAEAVFPGEGYGDLARRTAAWAATTFGADGAPWPCGVPGAGETPNLMLGLAGIGTLFLRLRDPAAVPNPLLPGPRNSGSA